MPRHKIISNELYHVYNRGTDKRKIFLDNYDYLRFIHDLFEFNNEEPVLNAGFFFKNQYIDVGRRYIDECRYNKKPRKLLVEILAFCLMPNHYHLLLKPKKDTGIAEFIKKINGGYAKYFNYKYKRSGTLFQGKYKAILIQKEPHFIHLLYYIHLNPLDLITPEWREKKIQNYKKSLRFLENYRWSSYLDYIGKKNFPSVTQRELLLNFFNGPKNYKKDTIKWLQERKLDQIKNLILE